MDLPKMGIFYHAESPFNFTQITASECAVWALREKTHSLVARVGIQHCPMGVDWVEDRLIKNFIIILYLQF